jgi:predicted enzyme related to lactoylglutathione lyase
MSLQLGNVTLDCADASRVARFWSAALQRPVDDGASDSYASIGAEAGEAAGPGWFFIKVPEGKSVKNRVHVDLRADDREREIERLLELGARRCADHDEGGMRWTTLADVEGNEFCVS